MLLVRYDDEDIPLYTRRLDWELSDRYRRWPAFAHPPLKAARRIRDLMSVACEWLRLPSEATEALKDNCRQHRIAVEYVFNSAVEGDIAEFGTGWGRSAVALAKAMARMHATTDFVPKNLHLFDSFEGLPESTSEIDKTSPLVVSGVWAAGNMKVFSPEELRKICARDLDQRRVTMHPGWFDKTVPALAPELRFSLLHVDCDLYQSTLDVLVPCFSAGRVSEGATILFDDWDSNRASPDKGERKAWPELVDKFSIRYSDMGSYGLGGKRVIVHSYAGMRKDGR
jgi:hypothetical protein